MLVRSAAERVARESYGRLLAFLSRRCGDIAAAEDALSDAFRAALEQWPARGTPERPEAWLLTVARRRLADDGRRRSTRDAAVDALFAAATTFDETAETPAFPDDRLAMLFVCAHDAIDPRARTPLMLQTVLGMDAAVIAAAFLTSPRAMGQRLVRAKRKVRDAHIRFAVPDRSEWPEKLGPVLDAIYAAYNAGWSGIDAGVSGAGLAREAIWLGSIVAELMPDEPETHGLLSLMLHCEARRAARFGPDGSYIPLNEQDATLWSADLIARAEQALRRAHRMGVPGRYQIEAFIQSAHAERARTGLTEWAAIVVMYNLLARVAPTVGALTSRAAAIGHAEGPQAGLAALDQLRVDEVNQYQPFWAVRAHLLAQAGEGEAAAVAYGRAIGLTEDARIRVWLTEQSQSDVASAAGRRDSSTAPRRSLAGHPAR